MFRLIPCVLAVVLVATVAAAGQAADPWEAFIDHAAAEHGDVGRRAATFLATHRPDRDDAIDFDLLADNLRLALQARDEFPWASSVPEDVFLNDVLPYAVLDETRESWRPRMYELGREIVKDCTTATEAAQALNREIFKSINVHYNTGRKKPNQSPAESIAQGRATCTGLSIILVDACRAVGVPARAAGIASWYGKGGNHTWVEIWDGRWYFTGADEYNAKGLNRAWFNGDAAKAKRDQPQHAVWASSWRPADRPFPLAWNPDERGVGGVNVTDRYVPAATKKTAQATRHVRVWNSTGGERLVASVQLIDGAGTSVATVMTRAGTADLNDMPRLDVPVGAPHTLSVEYEGQTRVAPVVAQTPDEQTVDLHWDAMGLDEVTAERMVQQRWAKQRSAIADERQAEIDAAAYTVGAHTMRLLEREFGEAPESGRSLWISMHGGGGAPAEVNDRQWKNQIRLYTLDEGIYLAPRAPTDSWNLWHQGNVDALFDRIIETYVATRNVNPDRVYLLGYSAGGDGVYQLAPRMADRFAAASMMAGHPNEASPLSLRNLPFAIFMGGKDGAYKRNEVAAKWGERLDELRVADPTGYPHRVTIYPEHAHWMQGEDAEGLPWMAEHTRHAWPERIVWYQDDVVHPRFYWLQVAPEDAVKGRTITATVDGQTIRIESAETKAITLRLRDGLVNLDQPLTVEANGAVVFEGVVPRTAAAIDASLKDRADPRTAATATLDVRW